MTSTLLRTGRSAVISIARDFSCALLSAEDEMISCAEALPVHVFGAHLQGAEMRRLHPDLAPGDAFLDNDPYVGNSHHADHTILVPVFVGGEHRFTVVAKAHMADIGNSQPTTYMPFVRDIYEEGALSFPCVAIQRDYTDIEDIIRMCLRRIRVPELWYGDYLAVLGAARIAERRLIELCERYGAELVAEFVREYLEYSERRAAAAIRTLPPGDFELANQHDSLGDLGPTPLKVKVSVDHEEGIATVDYRECPDCRPFGLNLSQATATGAAIAGIFMNFREDIPVNSGSFRRIQVLLRRNCVAGIPEHPTSCSMATTNIVGRLATATAAVFQGGGSGMAEAGTGMGTGTAVISGRDKREQSPYHGEQYINQLIIGNNGGPATRDNDGWLTYGGAGDVGLLFRDSVEVVEQKYPIRMEWVRLVPDSGGAGRRRGALGATTGYRAVDGAMTVAWIGDGEETPARGVGGGLPGSLSWTECSTEGETTSLPAFGQLTVGPETLLISVAGGGGGSGSPLERAPDRVLHDVYERAVSLQAAYDTYGVVLVGALDQRTLQVDHSATAARRTALLSNRSDVAE
jgi:N-methylhydantoinase B